MILKVACRIVAVGLLLATSIPAFSQKATDEQMALEALQSLVRTSNQQRLAQIIDRGTEELALRASDSARAAQLQYATIAFPSGKSAVEVESFAHEYELEVTTGEIKIPAGNEGRVMTFSLGSNEVLMLSGTLSERLSKAAGGHQLMLANLVESSADQSVFELFDAVVERVPRFYKLKVIGYPSDLQRAIDEGAIVALTFDSSPEAVPSYFALKDNLGSLKPSNPGEK
ncbi:MAG: hypothetical protein WDZ76_14720 [Pseudohongiellaceae bacterium]